MKYSLVRGGAVLVASSLFLTLASSAQAGWGHLRGGGSSGGSSGVYAAGYGSSGLAVARGSGGSSGYAAYSSVGGSSGIVASGGSSGGPGLLQRVAGRMQSHIAAKRARHAARRAAYGSSGVYASHGSSGYTSYSSVGGSSGYAVRRVASGGSSGHSGGSSGYISSRVSYGSVGVRSGGSSGAVYSSGVSYGSVGGSYYSASKNNTAAASSLVTNASVDGDAVYLSVAVPSRAKIYVNDNVTTSSGTVREFVSRGLKPGKSYKFNVRAELEDANGQVMIEEKTLVVSAGQREQLQFAFAEQAREVETAVTLNVPEGAEVWLAGNRTNAVGETRTYRTQQLKPGEVWDEYEIQVKLAGEVKSRKIRLIGGDDLQLTFAFDERTKLVAK